jgi:hypothetical protein
MVLVTCAIVCCTTFTTSSSKITKVDTINLNHARKRCGELYPDSPCLTKFTKVEDNVYRATCGPNNN